MTFLLLSCFSKNVCFSKIVNRSNQYVGVYSALVEVSRLVINWPSLTEATLASRQKDSSF